MENQHRKISGYRELSEREVVLMNKIKAQGNELNNLIEEVKVHIHNQMVAADTNDAIDDGEIERLRDAEPYRWAAIACTDIQQGLMALTRAVAQPTNF